MKSFKHHIDEARQQGLVKGWTLKNKIVSVTRDYSNYHIKQVVRYTRKFGLTKQKLIKILEDSFEDMSAPDPEAEALKAFDELYTGAWDNNVYIEEYLHKKGYCAFVIDKTHGSVTGQTEKECRAAAKALDAEYLPYERDGFKLFEIKPIKGKPKYITSKYDWYAWLEGKRERKYVSPMAQFRENREDKTRPYPASYVKNKKLMSLVRKHKDPLKFILDVMTTMSKGVPGGLSGLTRIGVANTREVAALWNDFNNNKIPSHMIESLIEEVLNHIERE